MFMQMLICLNAERKDFYCKSENLMSLLISVAILVSHVSTPAWCPHTKLYKLA